MSVHDKDFGEFSSKLESLLGEALSKSEQEAKQIVALAQAKQHSELSKLEEEFSSEREKIRRECEELAKQELAEKLAAAELEAQRLINSAKEEAVKNALSQLISYLRAERFRSLKKHYIDFLTRNIENAMLEYAQVIVLAGKEEYDYLKKNYPDLHLERADIEGIIIYSSDRAVAYDCTLHTLIEEHQEKLRNDIYRMLFTSKKSV